MQWVVPQHPTGRWASRTRPEARTLAALDLQTGLSPKPLAAKACGGKCFRLPLSRFNELRVHTRLYPRIIPRQAMSRPRIFMRARRGATDSAKCFAPARGPELAVGCDATPIIYSTSRSSLSDAKMVASNSGKFGGRGRGRENIDWKPAPPLRQQSHLGNIAGASMPCRATCGGAAFGARPF